MGLPEFEGRAVVRSAVKITRAGDGLSEALKLEPTALHHGDEDRKEVTTACFARLDDLGAD